MKKNSVLFLVIPFIILFISSVGFTQEIESYPVSLKGKRIAVFLDNQYQVGEAYYAPLRFKEAGAEVKIVSHDVPMAHRYRPNFIHYLKTDITPKEALKTRWDGVVIIGGFSPLIMIPAVTAL